MYQFEFADSVIPECCRILKLPVLPYSLGHEILLQKYRNVLVCGDVEKAGQVEKRSAIIQAALICSRTWEGNKKPSRNMTLWGWMISRADFDEAIFDFNAYRKAGTMFPKIHTDKPCEPENAMGSPHLACIYDYASARFGIDAFDQPLGALQFGYFAFLESKGMIQIQNEHYRQIDAEIAQHIADLAAEKAAEKRKTEQCLH